MPTLPKQLDRVSVPLKANVYFDGKVISHTLLDGSGARKTLGVIWPGEYHFNTDAAERMDIIAGQCRVKQDGAADWKTFAAGEAFEVPAKSGFDIAVDQGLAEYLCTFK
jgi:uncharacterized protein YaiE (UPF0345 family)